MNFKMMLPVGMLFVLIGAQCSGAADLQEEKNRSFLREAEKGNIERVKMLLAQKADIHATNDRGKTVVNLAAYMAQAKTVALLVENGASISAVDAERIMLCVSDGEYEKMAKLLIAAYYKAVINKINKFPMIALLIPNHSLINENELKFPNETLEHVASYLLPGDLACFRLASKDLRTSASKPFEEVKKIMILQLKEKLINFISDFSDKAQVIDTNRSCDSRYGRGKTTEMYPVMALLKRELKRAKALDENMLLQREVVCLGHRRDLNSGMWVDLNSGEWKI